MGVLTVNISSNEKEEKIFKKKLPNQERGS